MTWYEQTREKTESIFQSIIQHDFINGLMDGTLPKDVFGFYVNQDTLYLSQYTKVLSQVGVTCYEDDDIQFYLESATGIAAIEKALHQVFLDAKYLNSERSPTCELYCSYLSRMVHNHSVEVGLAAVLPCFTIYKEVGDYILANQTNQDTNPYQEWIGTYGGEEFSTAVANALEITNRYAENASADTRKRMEEAFIKASQLEYMFWDSAYKQEKWQV
jgi:thiaminase/transcriptional activator TenA